VCAAPLQSIKAVVEKMQAAGAPVELFLYEHCGHAFMNALTAGGREKIKGGTYAVCRERRMQFHVGHAVSVHVWVQPLGCQCSHSVAMGGCQGLVLLHKWRPMLHKMVEAGLPAEMSCFGLEMNVTCKTTVHTYVHYPRPRPHWCCCLWCACVMLVMCRGWSG
jgi:hypothetical protein